MPDLTDVSDESDAFHGTDVVHKTNIWGCLEFWTFKPFFVQLVELLAVVAGPNKNCIIRSRGYRHVRLSFSPETVLWHVCSSAAIVLSRTLMHCNALVLHNQAYTKKVLWWVISRIERGHCHKAAISIPWLSAACTDHHSQREHWDA